MIGPCLSRHSEALWGENRKAAGHHCRPGGRGRCRQLFQRLSPGIKKYRESGGENMSQSTMSKSERKARKKTYRKAKRKYVQPWKLLAILLIIPVLLIQALGVVVDMADNTLAIVTGDHCLRYWLSMSHFPCGAEYGRFLVQKRI